MATFKATRKITNERTIKMASYLVFNFLIGNEVSCDDNYLMSDYENYWKILKNWNLNSQV